MNSFVRQFRFAPTAVAVAVLSAFGPAQAEDEEAQIAEISVTAGAAGVTGDAADRALFGQYNGMRDSKAYGLLGVDYIRRNNATGSLVEFYGSNLAMDTRELGLLWAKQGNWRLAASYGELVRRDPYTLNSVGIGLGTTTPQLQYWGGVPGTGPNFDLETKRKAIGLGAAKWITSTLELSLDAKSENKDGSRLFGIGITCPSTVAPACGPTTATSTGFAVLAVPEPINSNHSQVETRLTYAGARLRLNGGYYGSFYSNSNGSLNPGVPATLNNPVGAPLPLSAGLQTILTQPVALPPDNQVHQFDVGGNFVITPTSRATFKVAHARASQDQDFAGAGLTGAPAGVTNLNGKVNTTTAQLGLSARPLPQLTVIAESKFEDREDKTPLANYGVEGTALFTNRAFDYVRVRNKLQGTYRFARSYAATVGFDQESIDRGSYTATSASRGVSALRQDTDETAWRAELRRQMTTNFSGSIAYISAKRDGSAWLRPSNTGRGVIEVVTPFVGDEIFMPTQMDRQRDKIRLNGNWQATESFSLQISAEQGKDEYTAPTAYALRDTKVSFYSLDGNYVLSEEWSLNGYLSQGNQKLNQARPAGYVLAFDNKSTSAGFGVVGKPSETIDVGGGLSFINDKNVYAQSLDPGAGASSAALLAASGGLPDIVFRRTELRLYGRYALSDNSALRLDAIHQRAKYDDWSYGYGGVPFLYSDNSTVSQLQLQNVTFLGITYTYTWR